MKYFYLILQWSAYKAMILKQEDNDENGTSIFRKLRKTSKWERDNYSIFQVDKLLKDNVQGIKYKEYNSFEEILKEYPELMLI